MLFVYAFISTLILCCLYNKYSADQNNQKMELRRRMTRDAWDEIYELRRRLRSADCDARYYAKKVTELKKSLNDSNSERILLEQTMAHKETQFHDVHESEKNKYLKTLGYLMDENICLEIKIDTKDEELDRLLHKIEILTQTGADDGCSVCFESVSRFVTHVRPIY